MSHLPGSRERQRDRFPLIIENTSGEDIPAHACMQIDGAEGVPVDMAQVVKVVKPTGATGQFAFNGPFKIPAAKKGRGRYAMPCVAAFTGSVPAPGDTVGPSSGSWSVSTAESVWPVLGGAEDGVVLIGSAVGGASSLQWGEVTADVDAATGWLAASRGSGTVQFKDNETGADDGLPTAVANPFFDTFPERAAVCCDRRFDPPLIVSVGCTLAPA